MADPNDASSARPDLPPAGAGTLADTAGRLQFLAGASALLASSLTDWIALERLASLAVPALADWCAIDVVEPEGGLRRVAVVHGDPEKVAWAAELERKYPTDPEAPYGVPHVVRTGQAALYATITDAQLAASARDPAHLELIRSMGFHSAMIVPLAARGGTIGAITLVRAESKRTYTEADLRLANDLGRLAALAVENARLIADVEQLEHRYEALLDGVEAIVWEADPATLRFSFVSRRAEDLLGYPIGRWLKEPEFWPAIIHPQDRDRVLEAYHRAAREGRGDDFEFRAVASDGREVWLRDIAYAVQDEAGRTVALRGVMVDATDRMIVLRRIAAQHAATRVLAEATTLEEAAPDILQAICDSLDWDMGALWVVDAFMDSLRCVDVWHQPGIRLGEFEEMTRSIVFTRGVGLPGRVWASATPAWIPDIMADDNFPRGPVASRYGVHGAFGFPITLRGNVVGVLEFFSREIRGPDPGLLDMMMAIGTQIGQFVEAREDEGARRESAARLRAILSSALDCVIGMDHEGRVIEFNPAAERTFGYARGDVIGKPLADLIIPPGGHERHVLGLEGYLETGDAAIFGKRQELILMRADGTRFPAEVAVVPVESAGKPTFTGFLRDLTEQKNAEMRLKRNREQLEFLAEASAQLNSSLNHATVLERLARSAVPWLADWCTVDLVEEDGTLRRIATVHSDPAKVELARDLTQRHPPGPNADREAERVVRTGTPELYSEIPEELIREVSHDEEPARAAPELNFTSAMIVPLSARGRTFGALTLATAESGRRYGEEDLGLAQEFARRAALALDNARLYRERSYVARTLQRSLLPPHLPQIPGVEVAARYHAAGEGNEVGGDFYDLFPTARDDWAIVIGDVCGKGADAAALTALARYTLRAAAMQARKPSRVLGVLNEALLAEGSLAEGAVTRFCTVAYTRLRRTENGIRATTTAGGHPLPLLLRADGRIEAVCRPGTLIGVLPDLRLHDGAKNLEPGDALVLYTDGVTEARDSEGNVFGEAGLRALLASCTGLDASTTVERIERTVLELQAGYPRDDIALIVLRVPG